MKPQRERDGRLNDQPRTAHEFSFQGLEELSLTLSLLPPAAWNADFPAKLGSCDCLADSLGIAAVSFRWKTRVASAHILCPMEMRILVFSG